MHSRFFFRWNSRSDLGLHFLELGWPLALQYPPSLVHWHFRSWSSDQGGCKTLCSSGERLLSPSALAPGPLLLGEEPGPQPLLAWKAPGVNGGFLSPSALAPRANRSSSKEG
eukprot:8148422-Heterocapsa_arctica.AAC.1